jgi:hypothetical protein
MTSHINREVHSKTVFWNQRVACQEGHKTNYILKMLVSCILFIRRYDKLTHEGERMGKCRMKFVIEGR